MPLFKVWCPDYGQSVEDAKTVNNFDAESAAADWAHWYDGYSADYSIVGGEGAEVLALEDGKQAPVTVRVSGEMTRAYRGQIITAEEQAGGGL